MKPLGFRSIEIIKNIKFTFESNVKTILKMMLNIIMRKECSRCRCVLPFCYKYVSTINGNDKTPKFDSNKSEVEVKSCSKKSDENETNKLENNPYYAKYSHKIERMKQEGAFPNNKSNNGLKQSNNNMSFERNTQIKNEIKSENIFNDSEIRREFSSKSKSNNWSNRSSHSLDDIVKLDLLRDKTPDDVAIIWNSYHKSKDCIYAVIPGNIYDKIFSMASKYPTFIFPIPRVNKHQNDGNTYEFILCQFSGHQAFFTPLIAYQSHRENAPPCLTISHYPELQKDKGIVLMFGEYDKNILNCFESQCLANQLQWYYSGDQNMKQSILLHAFNKEPNLFNYMDLIKELETGMLAMGLSKANSSDNFHDSK